MNHAFIICILLTCVCLSVGSIIVAKRQPSIAIIDLDYLLSELSKPLAAQYPKGDVPKRVLLDLIEGVREDLETFALKRNVHLIAKQACFSRNPDLTEDFIKEIRHDNHENH